MKKKLYFILITLSFFAFKMKAQSIDTLKLSKPLLPNPLAEVHNSTTLFEKLLVLSPFVLTIFVLFILVKMLRRMDFDIKEALKEFPTDD